MPKQRPHSNQIAFQFEGAAIPVAPMSAEHAAIVHGHLPPPVLPPIIPHTAERPPPWDFRTSFPRPLQQALTAGLLGDEEPTTEHIEALHLEHANELLGILDSLDALQHAKETCTNPRTGNRPRTTAGQERLDEQFEREPIELRQRFEDLLAVYADAFGSDAARAFGEWVQAIHCNPSLRPAAPDHGVRGPLQDAVNNADVGAEQSEESIPAVSSPSAPQYAPGHPWHYLGRGDGQPPVPLEDIPCAEIDGHFAGKLPKDYTKRREQLSQLLADQLRQLDDDKARYRDIVERGALALSEYDRSIAYGGDHELAVASSLALKFNHICNGLGRVRWLRQQLEGTAQPIQPSSSSASWHQTDLPLASIDATDPQTSGIQSSRPVRERD